MTRRQRRARRRILIGIRRRWHNREARRTRRWRAYLMRGFAIITRHMLQRNPIFELTKVSRIT